MAKLSVKARVHQRKAVLPFDDAYDVEWLRRGGRAGVATTSSTTCTGSTSPSRRAGAT